MYEMLTGRVPFDADTPVSVALKQVQEEPVDPITYNPNIPISVNRIILKAMQKDPNLRYQNATEMIADLKMALKRPDEDFVVLAYRDDDSPTQKVPTIYELEMQKNNELGSKSDENKKDKKKKGKISKILEFISEHRFIKMLLILFALGIIFLIAALSVMMGIKKSVPKDAHIPSLVAAEYKDSLSAEEVAKLVEEKKLLTEEEAIAKLKKAGFENYEIERVSSDTVPVGYVVGQNPNDSIAYKITQIVKIKVSSGPEIVKLPDSMVGKNIEDVKDQLKKLGMPEPIINYETNEEKEAGMILSIDPADIEGEEIEKSRQLSFVVSSGSQYADVTMINVVGDDEATAITKLEAQLNLVVNVKYDENTNKDNGVVLAQTIEAGKVIKEQTEVTITVNKLPEEHTVTFNINVASYFQTTNITNETNNDTSENTTNTTSSTSTNTVSKVKVTISVGGSPVYEQDVPALTTNCTYTTKKFSGNQKVRISVGNIERVNETINFSEGDKTIDVNSTNYP